MKLFNKKEKYELYTYSSWGNYRDVDEVVLEGSKAEIKEYAKKAEFVWHEDASRLMVDIIVKALMVIVKKHTKYATNNESRRY